MTKEEFFKQFTEKVKKAASEIEKDMDLKDVQFDSYEKVLQMTSAILAWNVRASYQYKDMQEQMNTLGKDIDTLKAMID